MKQIKKTLIGLFLSVAMIMGQAGSVFASEPELCMDTEADSEALDPTLNQYVGPAYITKLYAEYYLSSNRIIIYVQGQADRYAIYINNQFYKTVNSVAPSIDWEHIYFDSFIQGGSYTIKLVPYLSDNEGAPASTTITVQPQKLSNLNISTGKVRDATGYMKPYLYLSWDTDTDDNLNYEVWRKEGSGAWKKLAVSHYPDYSDDTVISGKKYMYRVRVAAAKDAYGNNVPAGKWLTSKSGKVQIKDVTLSIDYTDYAALTITPSKNGVISGYEIWRSTKRTKGYKKIATITETTYTDKKVKRGTYYYKVRSYYYDAQTGKKSYGSFSDVEPIKLILGDMKVTAKQTGKSQATVSWNKVKNAEKYEVWYKSDVIGDGWKRAKTTKRTSCKISGLLKNKKYTFVVKAVKGNNKSMYFTKSTAYCYIGFQAPSVEIAKRTVTASAGKDSVKIKTTIRWDRIYDAKKILIIGGKWSHYENGEYTDDEEKIINTLKGTATSYTVTTEYNTLKRDYDYVKVVAVNSKNEKMEQVGQCDVDCLSNTKKVTVKKKDNASATVSWKAVPGATGYYVYETKPDCPVNYNSYKKVYETKFIDQHVVPGVHYVYYVFAFNDKIGVSASRPMKFDSQGTVYQHKLAKPNINNIKNVAGRKAKITWNHVADARKYIVYRATSKKGKYKKIAITSDTSLIDRKLKKGKIYYYKIKAEGNNIFGITVTSAFSGVKAVKIKK